jgi:hypothetical protein
MIDELQYLEAGGSYEMQDIPTTTHSATSQKAGIYVGDTILTEILTVLSADPHIVVALTQKGPQPLLCFTHNHPIK